MAHNLHATFLDFISRQLFLLAWIMQLENSFNLNVEFWDDFPEFSRWVDECACSAFYSVELMREIAGGNFRRAFAYQILHALEPSVGFSAQFTHYTEFVEEWTCVWCVSKHHHVTVLSCCSEVVGNSCLKRQRDIDANWDEEPRITTCPHCRAAVPRSVLDVL